MLGTIVRKGWKLNLERQGLHATYFRDRMLLSSSSSSSIERSGFFEKNVQLSSKGERDSHLLPRLKTIKSLLKTVCVEH